MLRASSSTASRRCGIDQAIHACDRSERGNIARRFDVVIE
jgi:hypothetical protein